MSVPNYRTYKQATATPSQRALFNMAGVTAGTAYGQAYSVWTVASSNLGLIPSTSVAVDYTTNGALSINPTNSSPGQFVSLANITCTNPIAFTLIDRLVHQGGLSAAVSISAQTTNLPTAAITRTTGSYAGIFAAIEIYSAAGATAALVSGSYTNQDGLAGRTFVATNLGASTFNNANRFIMLPLQAGDTGVKSVQSIVLSTSTGAAGNIGVTLFRPLATYIYNTFGSQPMVYDPLLTNCGQMPYIANNACLSLIIHNGYISVASGLSFTVDTVDDPGTLSN